MVATFDPLSPSSATTSSHPDTSTFHTLTRERAFRHPSFSSSDIPALDQLVAPHIESFDALIEDEAGKGMLQLGVEDLGERVVFDGREAEGLPLGTKITCKLGDSLLHFVVPVVMIVIDRIERVVLSKPLVPDRDKLAVERRIFPSEVS